jgi:hypothetical protein
MIGVGIPIILMIRPYPLRILPGGVGNNINAINIVTSLCEPEGHGNLVFVGIASSSRPGGIAMTLFLLRLY